MKPWTKIAAAMSTAAVTVCAVACSGGGHTVPALPAAPLQSASPAVVPAGWALTATRGSTVRGGTDLGPLPPSTPMTVRLGLALHNVDQLKSLTASRRRISSAQFATQYGASPAEAQAVTVYLQSQGFTNVKVDGQLVSADGSAAQVAAAFDTTLESFRIGGAAVYANTRPAIVPAALGAIVTAVLGLNNVARMKTHIACFTSTVVPAGGCAPEFGAQDAQTFYDVGATADASQTAVAVIAAGDMTPVVADLRMAESAQNLPQVPVTVIAVSGTLSQDSNELEWALDSQSATGIAQKVGALYLYAATSLLDSDTTNAFNAWAVSHRGPLVANASFGECESDAYADGAMAVDDNLFLQASSLGATMFVATGDDGSACSLTTVGGSAPPTMVQYPASSPYVVAVGGTSAVASAADGTYMSETAWSGGGGGISTYETAPASQQAVLTGTTARGVPDIAMAADPNSGSYRVYGANIAGVGDCSAGCGVGGTSEASPLAMGAYARILSAHVNEIGYATPLFYALIREQRQGFHDVLTGSNGAYTAHAGYDYTTGLGSIDISVMNANIAN